MNKVKFNSILTVSVGMKPSSLHNLAISRLANKVRSKLTVGLYIRGRAIVSKHSCGKVISHPALEQL